MRTVNLREEPQYLKMIHRVAGKYRKHSAIVTEAASFTNSGSFWDGGSRSSHWLVNGPTVQAVPGPTAPPQFGGCGPVTIPLPRGQYVVTVGTFLGKTATAKITIGTGEQNEDDL